jgi:hypothetical protein
MDSDGRRRRLVYRKWEDSVEMRTRDTVLSVHMLAIAHVNDNELEARQVY